MRWILLALSLSLFSCSGVAVLYTDEVFRYSSPEIIEAWASLGPLQNAKTELLPPGTGFKHLQALIDKTPGLGAALIGVSLTPVERRSLEATRPQVRFLFVVPGGGTPEEASLSVHRSDAWSTVARGAAKPGPATALFPPDATATEIEEFRQAWTEASGGPLTINTGGGIDLNSGSPEQVFQWANNENDSRVQELSVSIPVHGNPGLLRSPGSSGLTWKIRQASLGSFLWRAVWDSEKKSHFLPLETVLDRR